MAIIDVVRQKLFDGQEIFRKPTVLQLVADYSAIEWGIEKMRTEYNLLQQKVAEKDELILSMRKFSQDLESKNDDLAHEKNKLIEAVNGFLNCKYNCDEFARKVLEEVE
jgi:hypothetical protein